MHVHSGIPGLSLLLILVDSAPSVFVLGAFPVVYHRLVHHFLLEGAISKTAFMILDELAKTPWKTSRDTDGFVIGHFMPQPKCGSLGQRR